MKIIAILLIIVWIIIIWLLAVWVVAILVIYWLIWIALHRLHWLIILNRLTILRSLMILFVLHLLLRLNIYIEFLSAFWAKYLDLDRDYAAIRRAVSVDAQTARCADSGAGIRILRQEPWEALISFIISQCNNIPRIQGIISRLCALYGEIIDGGFAFPTPEALSCLSIEDLAPLRCGYRAPYILSSAQAVSGRSLDLSALESANTETILRALLALPGVGIKVASCVLLFGFHRLEAFPVDTWIRKALKQDYGPDFDPAKAFGPYAGIAQQYIFYHARGKNLA